MLDVSVSYEKKQAVVRFEVGKARLPQILKRYAGTAYSATAAGPVATIARGEHVTVRAWADPTELIGDTAGSQETAARTTIYIELIPSGESRFVARPQVELAQNPSELGLERVSDVAEINAVDAKPPLGAGARRFSVTLRPAKRMAPGPLSCPIRFQYSVLGPDGSPTNGAGKVTVPLDIVASGVDSSVQGTTGVALVGGSLDLGLRHLCDQTGCVDHFCKSLGTIPGLVGVRPQPSLLEPRATVFVQAGRAIDVWSLREKLREQGLEIRQLVPRDLGRIELHVELYAWQDADDLVHANPCEQCRDQTLAVLQSLAWTSEAVARGSGVTVRTRDMNADACIPLDKLEEAGLAPHAVWLTPQGVTAPEPAPPRPKSVAVTAKTHGSESHPLIQFDLAHHDVESPGFTNALTDQVWASRTGMAGRSLGVISPRRLLPGAGAVAAVGDRQRADLVPLMRAWQSAGRRPTRIRLTEFGDLRVQFDFAHLCGEVEYSKPPKSPDKKSEEQKPAGRTPQSENDAEAVKSVAAETSSSEPSSADAKSNQDLATDQPTKDAAGQQAMHDEKPFVPRPLRPAPSSNARQAIERAIATVKWVEEGTYHEYHTKPEFDGPRSLTVSLRPAGDGVVRLDELTRALTQAGFPPTAIRVSRLFPGLPFGHAVPPDLELCTTGGETPLVSSYHRAGRPLAVAFISLYCPNWDKYIYEADPKFFAKFKQLIDSYRDRIDFVAISSNPNDKVVEVAECLKRAEIQIPLLNDSDEKARAVFNAQITPPPHLFVFDADGLLRYAGDPHSNWNEPSDAQQDFLGPALEAVLAGTFAANGAVSFNSPKCNCSSANCKCPKCGCGPTCRCAIGHCKVGF